MPLRTEYSCRLRDPEEFQKKSFRRIESGDVDLIIARPCIPPHAGGKRGGMKKTRAQAIRYPRELWDKQSAKRSCKKRGGQFEPVLSGFGQIKEAWQMTQEEYVLSYATTREKAHVMYGKPAGKTLDIVLVYNMGRELHQKMVEDALRKGFPVPTKVLKDYPDLTPQPKHQPRPLPPDAQNIQDLSFNSDQFTCYGKPTGRGFRAYCRRR